MKRSNIVAAVALGIIAIACHSGDALHPGSTAPTKVLLTDDPFPYDTVKSINIFVTRIEAQPRDTAPADRAAGGETWVEIATPRRSFDLLTLQQGATAFVGEGTLDAGQYLAVRMTIDVDRSSIKYLDGSDAVVHWPTPGQGELVVYADVAEALAVPATGAEIVIDFDVGQSFRYKLFGALEFEVQPLLRAVNSAATGAIAGSVSGRDIEGQSTAPVQNANVTVYGGDPSQLPSTWFVAATGRTDAQGHYKIAFLQAGPYIVRVEQPDLPWLAAVTAPGIQVTVGNTTPYSVVLSLAGAGGAFINITGPGTVGVGGTIVLRAAVGDSTGNVVASPVISWRSRDSLTAMLLDSSYSDTLQFVLGMREGTTWIVATSPTFLVADSVQVQVVSSSSSTVTSVTISPPSLDLTVGDSAGLTAVLRDSAGNVVSGQGVQWNFLAGADSTVVDVYPFGLSAVVRAKHSGSTMLRAVEPTHGAYADITITVHSTTGGSFVHIFGADTVIVGGTTNLYAAVADSNGIPVAHPQVTWFSRDTSIAHVQPVDSLADSLGTAIVTGRVIGSTWIVAQSGSVSDSIAIQVVNIPPPPVSVASIQLTPASMVLAVGDSNSFSAVLKDSAGNVLTNRQISWFLTDSSGVAGIIWSVGETAWVRGEHSGITHIRAASESVFKDATITVP
jgi:uncharacterized protein YjdB